MIITRHGLEFFKIQFGDIVIATNPPNKESSFKGPRFGADMVLVSAQYDDFNGANTLSYGNREPFEVRGPGEYEIKGVVVRGFSTFSSYQNDERINTVYSLSLESMQIAFLGAIGKPEIPAIAKEAFDSIDILFVPIGGKGVLSPKEAYKLALLIEPKIIIPMHYDGLYAEKGALQVFLKEAGANGEGSTDKLTIKRKDLEGKEMQVIVLKQT